MNLFYLSFESTIPSNWKVKWKEKTFNKIQTVYRERRLKQKLSEWYSNQFLSSIVYGIGRIYAIFWELFLWLKSLFISKLFEGISEKHNNVDLKWNFNWEDLVNRILPELFKGIKRFEIKKNAKNQIGYF